MTLPKVPLYPTIAPEQFWYVVDKYDELVDRYRLPTPKLRTILTQFSLIDSNLIQEVGEELWGTGGEHAGLPGKLAMELPIGIEAAVGKAAERWSGQAFNSYRQYMTQVEGVLGRFTEPAQQVGDVLVKIAEAFRTTWIEVVGLLVTVAGVIVAVAALAVPLPDEGVSKILGVIVLAATEVLAAITVGISAITTLTPRITAAHDAMDTLTGELRGKIPTAPDGAVPAPDGHKWQAKTADPTN
jgi:hypothetical protein